MSKKSICAVESHQSASESSDTWKLDDEWWAEWRVRLSAWPETNRPYRPQLGEKWVAPSLKEDRKAWTKEAISLAKQRHSHHAPIRDSWSWFETNYPRFAELLALYPHLREQVSLTDAEKSLLITQELAEHGAAVAKDNSSWKVRDAVDLCIRFALRSSEAIDLVELVEAAVNRTGLSVQRAKGKHAAAERAVESAPEQPKPRPCDLLARSQYIFALQQDASLNTDREVYDWLSECKSIDSLPSFENWSRYLRRARKAHSEEKNTPRIGNPTKSVVPKDRI